MRIKYADLELRWMSFEVRKSPKLETRITSSIGYYHPQTGRWVEVGTGPTLVLDEQATIASTMTPLPPQLDSLGKVIEGSAYLALSGAYMKELTLKFRDPSGNPITRISGSAELVVPGRETVRINLPGKIRTMIAAQAELRVNAEGYRQAVWTGSVLDNTELVLTLEPAP